MAKAESKPEAVVVAVTDQVDDLEASVLSEVEFCCETDGVASVAVVGELASVGLGVMGLILVVGRLAAVLIERVV